MTPFEVMILGEIRPRMFNSFEEAVQVIEQNPDKWSFMIFKTRQGLNISVKAYRYTKMGEKIDLVEKIHMSAPYGIDWDSDKPILVCSMTGLPDWFRNAKTIEELIDAFFENEKGNISLDTKIELKKLKTKYGKETYDSTEKYPFIREMMNFVRITKVLASWNSVKICYL